MTVLPGDPPVPITLRRSARARRFSLRVSRLDGRVTLSLPSWAREADALAFARDRENWIRTALEQMPQGRPVEIGARLPVEGREVVLAPGRGRAPRLAGVLLEVPGDPERAGARVAGFLKTLARDRLSRACDRHAAALGRGYSRLVLRDTRSRWGSCTVEGKLMFSWRLVMAPPEVLDYVAAHEVAHLVEMNHSPAFWAVVARLFPDHAAQRAWLRHRGHELHAIRFGD
ncbi:M48 family metallopeptidase [Acidimangrovimonas pyrenivorans]|uniref:M48 family metallopeptidase n=1 Tax=Acidimangrovimonas pyrenivorans TaxID=2030798 RepID=A0ABV7ABW5_9RHOB